MLVVNSAIASEDVVKVYGPGVNKCDTFIKSYENKNTNAMNIFKIWVSGYLTSYNTFVSFGGLALEVDDSDKIMSDIYNSCKKDSKESVATTIAALSSTYVTDDSKFIVNKQKYVKDLCEKISQKSK